MFFFRGTNVSTGREDIEGDGNPAGSALTRERRELVTHRNMSHRNK